MIGRTLSHFEITAKLGEGGMGEVYRATDPKLGRDVAIKVLPEAFVADEERLARFEREARVLASLSHSNIAGIFEVGEQDETHFLVMELAEGETLAERIARGPVPLDEAISIALQVAEAVEAAHERGIVHRDLKPANVKVTLDGQVKVLDFGLAKALTPEPISEGEELLTQSPTLTAEMTGAGVLLGTAAYMSPEQARGKPVDKRADIWAFGCVFFEMLTGKRAFDGETISDTIGAVLRAEPELDRVPVKVRHLIRLCLQKDPQERLRDIGDARLELAQPRPELADGSRRPNRMIWLLWAVAAVLTGTLLWVLSTAGERPLAPGLSRHFTLTPQVFFGFVPVIALSPDGRHLAYVGRPYGERERLFIQDLHEGTVGALASTRGANYPFFSPDGGSLAFFAEGQLRKADLDGGPSQAICDIPDFFGGSWTTAGEIVYGTPNSGLFVVRASGGVPRPLTMPAEDGMVSHRWPHVLPDGEGVLFTVWYEEETQEPSIGWVSLATGETKVLRAAGSRPILLGERYLVYASEGVLMGVDFDVGSTTTRGEPVPLVDSVFMEVDGYVPYGVADDGLLVYAAGEDYPGNDASVVRVDRQGREERLVAAPGHAYRQPSLSPDGRRLALSHMGRDGIDIRLYDLERRTLSVVTPRTGAWPVWTPDGRHVAFVGSNLGQWNVLSAAADGRGKVEPVIPPFDARQCPTSYSPDGVLAFERGPIGARDIWLFDPKSAPSTRPFLATGANERGARFSPDGIWVAFTSDQSGRDEVYVARASGEGDIIPISNEGGREPLWAQNLDELFYRNGTRMMSVPISIDDELEPGRPSLLFTGEYSYGYLDWAFNYDVSPDGRFFYMVKESAGSEPRLQVVTHWIQELEKALAGDR